MTELTLRRAVPEDAPELTQLRLKMYAELESALDEGFASRTEAFFGKALGKDSFVTYVLTKEEAIVATGSLTFFEVPPTARQPLGHSSRLMNVYTLPEHRRQGCGERILTALMESAKQRGCERILLYSLPAGRRLYQKMGFVPLGDEWEIMF